METILWRRLDIPGHDACRLIQSERGWRLEGATTFSHEGSPASLAYEVHCDHQWRTRQGTARGWIGEHSVDVRITRLTQGIWKLNGQVVCGLDDCVDLDFGFTPATNLFQIRRIALEVGQGADVNVAWFDVASGTLEKLHQRYERSAADSYRYDSSRFNYHALLRVNPVGFVNQYPDLWQAVS